ncbi:MAG: hypothetical protein RJS98_11600 [Rhodospirillaceae bacterium]
MSNKRAYYKITAVIVCLSFLYAPISDVLPGWFGFEVDHHHTHVGGTWHGPDDHQAGSSLFTSADKNEHDTLHLSRVSLDGDKTEKSSVVETDQKMPNGLGHHVHLVEVVQPSTHYEPPHHMAGDMEIMEFNRPEYRLSPPLLKPPKLIA